MTGRLPPFQLGSHGWEKIPAPTDEEAGFAPTYQPEKALKLWRLHHPHVATAEEEVDDPFANEFVFAEPMRWPRLQRCFSWSKTLLALMGCLLLAALVLGWGLPVLLDKVVIPLLQWEARNLGKPLVALIGFTTMALFPALLLPVGPFMWLSGIVFGYFWGTCLILAGSFLGMTIPYFVGHKFLHHRIQAWLATRPRNAALLQLAERGGSLHQFRVVVLLRFSPFPSAILNYLITATRIRYGPYIGASMLALVPESLVAVYCGRLLKTLADMHQKRQLSPVEIAYEAVGLCVAVGITISATWYGQKALRNLEEEEAAAIKLVELTAQRAPVRGYRRSLSWSAGNWDSPKPTALGNGKVGNITVPRLVRFHSTGNEEAKRVREQHHIELLGIDVNRTGSRLQSEVQFRGHNALGSKDSQTRSRLAYPVIIR